MPISWKSDYGFFSLVSWRSVSAFQLLPRLTVSNGAPTWRASIPFLFKGLTFPTTDCLLQLLAGCISRNVNSQLLLPNRVRTPFIESAVYNFSLLIFHIMKSTIFTTSTTMLRCCCCYGIHIVNREDIEDTLEVERFLCWCLAWQCFSQGVFNSKTTGLCLTKKTWVAPRVSKTFPGSCLTVLKSFSLWPSMKLFHWEK